MLTTRFAPSPTGFLHIGGLRTALYNYLYARKNGGKFILRIEDTDLKRNSQEATEAIKEAFAWCGLDYDGEVTYQSQRFNIYAKFIQKLLDEGKAYKCYMSKEELDELRKKQEAAKERPKYDGRYRDFKGTPPAGIEPVVRIKAPLSGEICFKDGVKGEVKFRCEDILDDFIIARSDGTPTYNFTVVVDDALMGVTHIIRGDDHLSNTPKQIVLYNALGFALPEFFHTAMINGSDGAKLSKRHGATDVMEYKKMGYLAEALLNFLVRLGWSYGDEEIFTLEDMLAHFDPHNLSRSASTYNASKLEWLNQHYIKTLPYERLQSELVFFGVDLEAANLAEKSKVKLLIDSLRERSKTLVEMALGAQKILILPQNYEEAGVKKFCTQEARELFAAFVSNSNLTKFAALKTAAEFSEFCTQFLEAKGAKLKTLAQPLRLALTGSTVSAGIFEMMEILGVDECARRFVKFAEFLQKLD